VHCTHLTNSTYVWRGRRGRDISFRCAYRFRREGIGRERDGILETGSVAGHCRYQSVRLRDTVREAVADMRLCADVAVGVLCTSVVGMILLCA
jgi:hypothetical protein